MEHFVRSAFNGIYNWALFFNVLFTISQLFVYLISEPNGREQSIVQNNHHISMVPTLLGHSLFKQEGSSGREDYVFASGRLLP